MSGCTAAGHWSFMCTSDPDSRLLVEPMTDRSPPDRRVRMAISRRRVLTGGAAAGVGLSVAGMLPTLAEPAAASSLDAQRGGGSSGRPFPPLQDDPNGI